MRAAENLGRFKSAEDVLVDQTPSLCCIIGLVDGGYERSDASSHLGVRQLSHNRQRTNASPYVPDGGLAAPRHSDSVARDFHFGVAPALTTRQQSPVLSSTAVQDRNGAHSWRRLPSGSERDRFRGLGSGGTRRPVLRLHGVERSDGRTAQQLRPGGSLLDLAGG